VETRSRTPWGSSVTNRDRILALIQSSAGLTDRQIRQRTGIEPHQQVNQICRSLVASGLIRRVDGPDGYIVNVPVAVGPAFSGNSGVSTSPARVGRTVAEPRRRTSESQALPLVDPRERMFVVSCSGAKKTGGDAPTGASVVDRLPALLASELVNRRSLNAPRVLLDESTLRPAMERYDGHMYRAGGPAIGSLLSQGSDVVILSGGYGLVLPEDAIGMYNCEFRPAMWPDRVVERCLSSLAKSTGVKEVVGVLSMTTGYAKVFRRANWPASVESVYLLSPEPVGGAMVKAPRAQGEALATISSTGELPSDWESSDGLRMMGSRLELR